jgi:hypothetical protein
MVYYPNPLNVGTKALTALGDGQTINVSWYPAAPTTIRNKIAYHIYYSTIKENVFYDGVKYIVIDGYTDGYEANLIGLTPGQEYFIAVRPVEYDGAQYDLTKLPIAYDNLRFYPTSMLKTDITATSLSIPLLDVADFPSTGVIKIGIELIQYLSVDTVNSELVLSSLAQRGVSNTHARSHTTSGWDGYYTWDPTVSLFTYSEAIMFDRIYVCQSRFEYPNFPMTLTDGYRQVLKDVLSSDYISAEETNLEFPAYDYAGYHRTDPVQLLNGTCVGSYIGGEMGCIDGYGNVTFIRGMSVQDHNNQRQELLLSVTGRPACLIKRTHTGITCACYLPTSQYADDRCPYCNGTKFVVGYEQFFNPRRSDGRILVRIGPTAEVTKMYEAGLESEFPLDVWTMASPIIKNRDILVLFDQDNNEDFRYEVMDVTRNNMLNNLMGGQKFKAVRIRKTDPAYQIRIFRDTSLYPSILNTGIGFAPTILPHTHTIHINENIISISQINQTTSVSQGHSHSIVNGVIQESGLAHTHTIILP